MQSIEEEFIQILNFMGIPNDQIRNEASFSKDFDFDELQFTYLALYIGIFFKVNFNKSDYEQISTMGNAIDFVKRKNNSH